MRTKLRLFSEQLNRDVELHIILPGSYTKGGQKYPVLYFYDGDRIYDDPKIEGPSALSGSFEYGAYLEHFGRFLPEILLVGIAPPPDMWRRTAEYSPYTKHFDVPDGVRFEPYIQGKGRELGRWVVSTLKPWIDEHYRTLPDAGHTAIGGLSTSGVSALYMASAYPEVFHRFLIHAPACHLWMDKLLETVGRSGYSQIKYGYFDIGTDDCTRMVKNGEALADLLEITDLMRQNGLPEHSLRFFKSYRGTHECASWALTFPDAIRWVFQDA